MTTKETGMAAEIAKIIAEQIGGPAFAMMGAKMLVAGEESLTWKLGGGAKGPKGCPTHVIVTLEPMDTYRVETVRCTVRGRKELECAEGIYVEMLKGEIERQTGMYLSL